MTVYKIYDIIDKKYYRTWRNWEEVGGLVFYTLHDVKTEYGKLCTRRIGGSSRSYIDWDRFYEGFDKRNAVDRFIILQIDLPNLEAKELKAKYVKRMSYSDNKYWKEASIANRIIQGYSESYRNYVHQTSPTSLFSCRAPSLTEQLHYYNWSKTPLSKCPNGYSLSYAKYVHNLGIRTYITKHFDMTNMIELQ